MSKSPAAPLAMPLIPKKGEAGPAVTSFEQAPRSPDPPPPAPPPRLASRVQATIAVTVRLDEPRYERLKTWGTNRRVTNQEVIVAALDRFFRLSDEEREDLIATLRK
jgi:hypothetical protein